MNEVTSKTRFKDNGDGTVTDLARKRMWLKQDSWGYKGNRLSWWQCQEFCDEMNKKKFAGFSDWRIPNAGEAKELFDPAFSNTDMEGCEIHIDPVFSEGCGYTTWTTESRGAKAAMGYDYRSDYEYWLAKENDGFPSAVRLVRTPGKNKATLNPEDRFQIHKNGTISDFENNLMWKASDSFLDLDKWVSWEEAKTYIKDLNRDRFADYSDWRMPTRKEAQAIYDASSPVTDNFGDTVYIPKVFPPGSGQTTWTKTLHKTDPSMAMRFHYYNGDHKFHKRGLRSHGVRPVRDLKPDKDEAS
ncbi:MAG: DUF1566 domain-containing protein [Candidatus Nitronauta litoralis]|uniref:DUF1566 domain-containing protein n=1 Tax=Candidatus Nitronauta litoralis TaxID=2705533 RepID=A0A7T0BTV3_9BACT|nr:MAG: DUF1566 domain-containing protein [Candidatus Nitronauta litoralis]